MNCPTCGTLLGPVLEGSYSHYPPSRFCDKCVRFVEVPKETPFTQEELKTLQKSPFKGPNDPYPKEIK
jgi:hypothetical protein